MFLISFFKASKNLLPSPIILTNDFDNHKRKQTVLIIKTGSSLTEIKNTFQQIVEELDKILK